MKLRHEGRADFVELNEATAVEEPFWDAVLWKAQADRILEELDKLPNEYRLAVTLCDLEQMTYEEAAEALEVPIGTIRSRVFRGRSMLRAKLADFIEVPS